MAYFCSKVSWWSNSKILLSVSVIYLVLHCVQSNPGVYKGLDTFDVETEANVEDGPNVREEEDSLSQGRFRKRRYKRDLEEIVREKPIMYTPVIVERITKSLLQLRDQLNVLEGYFLNPNNITTALPPTTSTTTLTPTTTTPTSTTTPVVPGNVTTTPGPTTTTTTILAPRMDDSTLALQNHRLFLPIVDNNDNNGIGNMKEKHQIQYEVSSWPVIIRQADSSNISTTTTLPRAGSNDTTTTSPTTTTVSPVSNVTTTPVINVTTTTAVPTTPNATTTAGPSIIVPTREDITKTLRTVLISSEMIMIDQVSKDRVTELESCSTILDKINKYLYKIDIQNNTQSLLYWLVLTKLSVKHSIQRLSEQKATFAYIERLDDITSLITAGFCILALTLTIYMCYLSSRHRKPYVVNYHEYDAETSYRTRNNNNNSQPAVGIRPVRPASSIYSTPTGASVTTRSNPMYSSKRSVDGEQPTPEQMGAAGGLNNETSKPRADTVRFEPIYGDKNEKNSNLNRERRLSQQPNVNAPDYRDPRRDKKNNLDQYHDNEGFEPDDAVISKPNSESAL